MPFRFVSDPVLRLVQDWQSRPEFVLVEPLLFVSGRMGGEGRAVPAGLQTDLASIPVVAMGLIGYPGGRAAIVHDWLVRQPDVDRQLADAVFLDALIAIGVPEVTAKVMYTAVAGYTDTLRQRVAAGSWPEDPAGRVGA